MKELFTLQQIFKTYKNMDVGKLRTFTNLEGTLFVEESPYWNDEGKIETYSYVAYTPHTQDGQRHIIRSEIYTQDLLNQSFMGDNMISFLLDRFVTSIKTELCPIMIQEPSWKFYELEIKDARDKT